jgi:hypothetical protein
LVRLKRAIFGSAGLYSITSVARTSNEGGTVRPSALAVFMLIISSYLVGCSTGRSEGLLTLLAGGLVYGSPIIDQVRQRGGVEAEQIVDAIVREYRKEFGSDPANIRLQAIIFSAEKPS